MKKRVVILGAGYGGIFAAAHLCKENEYFSVSLIDKNPYLQLLQQIPYMISGSKRQEDVTVGVQELFTNEIERGYLEFNCAVVESIDLDNKVVRASNCQNKQEIREYKYDYLVISLGSETQYFNIPGAKENSLPFRSVYDALEVQKRISDLPKNSVIIIGGAGPTGVSLAAALSEWDMVSSKNIVIKIIDSANTVLPGWDHRLAKTSQKVLSSKGVEILTERTISQMTPRSIVTDSGEEIASDCTIWTAGTKGRFTRILPQIKKTRSDTIPVDSYFRISGFPSAYAIGDICEFTTDTNNSNANINTVNGDNGEESLPKLAQLAVRQARFVAENIARSEKGEDLEDRFTYHQRGHSLSLGQKTISVLSGLLVTGDMCNYTEDTVVDNFILEIKNREKGISAKALAAAGESGTSQYPTAFDFVTYATSDAFSDLVK
jgi:NADH dehydrogenase